MPALTTVLTNLAEKLTVLENYENQDCKNFASIQTDYIVLTSL